jgi:hypothetical protein
MDNNIKPEQASDLPFVDESIESVGGSMQNYLKRYPAYLFAGIIFLIVYYSLLLLFRVSVIQIYVIPVAVILPAYTYLLSRIRHEFMRQFARSNGFSYAKKGNPAEQDGALFKIGRSKSISDVVSGKFLDCPLELFTYTYVTSSGKYSQTHYFTVFKFHVTANMPDTLLENSDHDFGELFADRMAGRVPLKLEGDFNKYFNLSVTKEYEIEALQVFTPDVMVDLIDKCRELNLEMINDHIYIYKDSIMNSKKEIYSLYECATYFEEKLAPVLSRMKPALDAMENYNNSKKD